MTLGEMADKRLYEAFKFKAPFYINGYLLPEETKYLLFQASDYRVEIRWVNGYDSGYHIMPRDMARRMEVMLEQKNTVSTVCECGKEKHGFANHTTWCPCFK